MSGSHSGRRYPLYVKSCDIKLSELEKEEVEPKIAKLEDVLESKRHPIADSSGIIEAIRFLRNKIDIKIANPKISEECATIGKEMIDRLNRLLGLYVVKFGDESNTVAYVIRSWLVDVRRTGKEDDFTIYLQAARAFPSYGMHEHYEQKIRRELKKEKFKKMSNEEFTARVLNTLREIIPHLRKIFELDKK
ncbi:MAG: hypothetical protein AB1468_04400 [Candidatus Micrarchaeota archaeon]